MKKLINSFLVPAVISITLLSSCATEKVATEPSPPVVVQKPSPGPTYIMYGPEWKWDATKKVYVYVPGEWVVKQDKIWVRGHWKKVRGGTRWVPGHWQ